MLFLVFISPHQGVDRLSLYKHFEEALKRDEQLRDAVGIQRTFKLIGRDEVYLIARAENLIFLEQALHPLQHQADIEVTPVVELN